MRPPLGKRTKPRNYGFRLNLGLWGLSWRPQERREAFHSKQVRFEGFPNKKLRWKRCVPCWPQGPRSSPVWQNVRDGVAILKREGSGGPPTKMRRWVSYFGRKEVRPEASLGSAGQGLRSRPTVSKPSAKNGPQPTNDRNRQRIQV